MPTRVQITTYFCSRADQESRMNIGIHSECLLKCPDCKSYLIVVGLTFYKPWRFIHQISINYYNWEFEVKSAKWWRLNDSVEMQFMLLDWIIWLVAGWGWSVASSRQMYSARSKWNVWSIGTGWWISQVCDGNKDFSQISIFTKDITTPTSISP